MKERDSLAGRVKCIRYERKCACKVYGFLCRYQKGIVKMKNKFVTGIITGAACALIAATLLFMVYFASLPTNEAEASESNLNKVTSAADTDVQEDAEGVFSVSNDTMLEKLDYIKNMINTYSLYGATEEEMLEGMYRGLLWSIDDAYSAYYTVDEMNALMESSSGYYCGIGVMVSQNVYTGIITVVKPFKDGPAYNAGMRKEDILLKVEGEDVTGVDLNEVVAKIKGEEGTTVNVTVLRGEEEISMDVTRAWIEVPTIEYEMLDDKIGYISVSEFDEVTVDQFKNAIAELEKQKMEGLVIDLRDNPGGLVDSAVSMLDRILPKGLVVYTEDKNGNRDEEYAKDKTELKVPLVLLMNENSASASEIFAGAVQDFGKGKVVGTQSYGKGIVQIVAYVNDGSGIKFTVSQYFTPNGNAVHEVGITPDVVVELDEELKTLSEIPKEQDNQLQEAIKVLKEEIKKK